MFPKDLSMTGFEFKYIAIITILVVLFLSIRIHNRMNGKGCIGMFYIGLIVFSIFGLFLGASTMLVQLAKKTYKCVLYGEFHRVKVVDFESYISHDLEHGDVIMYTPIIEFHDNEGNLIRKELGFSTSGEVLDKSYDILYHARDKDVLTLGFILILSFFGASLFTFVLGILSFGLFLYALNQPMDRYWYRIRYLGIVFLIPILMIGFEGLLIYRLFYGNKVPIYITGLLILFIVVLGIGIWAYIKNIYYKGVPKFKRVSVGRWEGDWDK